MELGLQYPYRAEKSFSVGQNMIQTNRRLLRSIGRSYWPGYSEIETGNFYADVNDGGLSVDFATTAVLSELDEVSSLKDQRTRLKVFPYS